MFYFYSKMKELETEKIKESLFKGYSELSKYLEKIISFVDCKYSFIELFKIYISGKVINIFNEKFLLLIITNVVILYAPIEDFTDHFLFKSKMAIKQTIEGILCLINCFIPKYEEIQKEKI